MKKIFIIIFTIFITTLVLGERVYIKPGLLNFKKIYKNPIIVEVEKINFQYGVCRNEIDHRSYYAGCDSQGHLFEKFVQTTRYEAQQKCEELKDQYGQKKITCFYREYIEEFDSQCQLVPIGYQLFINNKRAGYEPSWTEDRAEDNCLWNKDRRGDDRVKCVYDRYYYYKGDFSNRACLFPRN